MLTLERMDGSAEMTAERAFIALVLMATALSLSTLRICEIHNDKDKSQIVQPHSCLLSIHAFLRDTYEITEWLPTVTKAAETLCVN